MTTTGMSTGLVQMVNVRDVITPSGVWALVVPGFKWWPRLRIFRRWPDTPGSGGFRLRGTGRCRFWAWE